MSDVDPTAAPDINLKWREWIRLLPCGAPAALIWLVPPAVKPWLLLAFLTSVALFWVISARSGIAVVKQPLLPLLLLITLAAVYLAAIGYGAIACLVSLAGAIGLLLVERKYSVLPKWQREMRSKVSLRLYVCHLTSFSYAYWTM